MGCYDVYCFVCGNPCHGILEGTIKELEEYMNTDLREKLSTYMRKYIKEIQSYPTLVSDMRKMKKDTKWMENCTTLTADNKIIHGVKETECNITFKKGNISIEHMINYESFYNEHLGIFLHTDCWKYIKNTYGIALKISDLPVTSISFEKIFNIDYGIISNYWEQDFNFKNIIMDKKTYLCSSPLKKDKNIIQIKKNIANLKLKKDPNRKGPSVSATFYNTGDVKIGNNGKMWRISNGKWIEIKEKIHRITGIVETSKLNNKQKIKLSEIPFIGLDYKHPVFIVSSKYQKSSYLIEFLCAESYLKDLHDIVTTKK